ncbi:MAG: class II glutamine amidotransferase [Bacteriovoracaceae bacterium]|nr:class II glutamine amidotransferase [Bacteriovoracaceae bacterium]
MCRIFGFRSVLQSRVHSSLISAENALSCQSRRHPDGWGLAYYLAGHPHVVKSTDTAETDDLFKKVSAVVSSETVLAHVRTATQGKLSLINTHPFQHGKWTFAHNGNIRDFDQHREEIEQSISSHYKRWRFGDTDSELIFHYLLSHVEREVDLEDQNLNIEKLMSSLARANENLSAIIGPVNHRESGKPTENYLTFVLTNGQILVAMHGGLSLHWSTHKKLCPERDTCSSLMPLCEKAALNGEKVNHLIVTSEPLQGENVWNKMVPGDMIGVDNEMKLHRHKATLPLACNED